MKGLAITDKGLEDISLLEIKELLKVEGKIVESGVLFDYKKKEDLHLLCYKAQSLYKIISLIDNFSVKKDLIKELKLRIKKLDLSKYKGTFAVRCWHKKIDNTRGEIEEAVGSVISGKVDLEDPEVQFFVFVYGKEVYFGVDVCGLDLSEREYKIFSHPHSLKGPVAYGLVRLSGWKKGVFLNYFCKSGEIGIEAALFGSGMSVRYYSKDNFDFDVEKFDKTKKKVKINCIDNDARSLAATKKNAKIGGVSKEIRVSIIEVGDLDIKFREGEVDYLVCQVMKSEEVAKIKELFYQTEFMLSGTLVLLCREKDDFDSIAKVHKFKKVEERMIERGGIMYKVLIYKK